MAIQERLRFPTNAKEVLDTLIFSNLARGNLTLLTESFNLTIPAGGADGNVINIPEGSVAFIYSQNEVTSSLYTNDLTASFNAGQSLQLFFDISVIMDRRKEFEITYYVPILDSMGWGFFNSSANPIDVNGTVQYILMNIGFYETWYRPFVDYNYKVINERIEEIMTERELRSP